LILDINHCLTLLFIKTNQFVFGLSLLLLPLLLPEPFSSFEGLIYGKIKKYYIARTY